jgi:hypothetical protein
MVQVPPPNTHQLLKIPSFLIAKEEDDRILDEIVLPVKLDDHDDTETDTEPELNLFSDNQCYNVIDKDNINFGTTSRGRRELHMCGYSYQVKKENTTTTRWRCIIRTPRCPATIHTNNVDDSFNHWNGIYHHHSPDTNRELIKNVIAKIKARVLIEPYPVVYIAEEEIRKAKMDKTQLAAMPLPTEMGILC